MDSLRQPFFLPGKGFSFVKKLGVVDWPLMERQGAEMAKRLGLQIDLRKPVGELNEVKSLVDALDPSRLDRRATFTSPAQVSVVKTDIETCRAGQDFDIGE